MKCIVKLIFAAAALSLSGMIMAGNEPQFACPSVGAIKNYGIEAAEVFEGAGSYAAYSIDEFATGSPWVFAIAPINADNPGQALEKGTSLLQFLSGNPSPQQGPDGLYFCEYDQINGSHAIAISFGSNSVLHHLKTKFRI